MTREEIAAIVAVADQATVIFRVPAEAGGVPHRRVLVPLGELLPLLGLPPLQAAAHALLWAGDRVAFSEAFLRSSLAQCQDHPEARTIFAEINAVSMRPDGGKIVQMRKNYCAWCHGDLDEAPHGRDDCPALPAHVPRPPSEG